MRIVELDPWRMIHDREVEEEEEEEEMMMMIDRWPPS